VRATSELFSSTNFICWLAAFFFPDFRLNGQARTLVPSSLDFISTLISSPSSFLDQSVQTYVSQVAHTTSTPIWSAIPHPLPINGNAIDIDGECETAAASPGSPKCSASQHCFHLRRPSTRLRCIFLLLSLVFSLFPSGPSCLFITVTANLLPSVESTLVHLQTLCCDPPPPRSFSTTPTTTLLRNFCEAAAPLHRICHRLQPPAFRSPGQHSLPASPPSSGCANVRHLQPFFWSLLLSQSHSTTTQHPQSSINLLWQIWTGRLSSPNSCRSG